MIAMWVWKDGRLGGDAGWNHYPDGSLRQWAFKTWSLLSNSPFPKGNLRGCVGRVQPAPADMQERRLSANPRWHRRFRALISLIMRFLHNVKTAKCFKALTWIMANIQSTKWTQVFLSWLKKTFIGTAIIAGRSACIFIWRVDWDVRSGSTVLRLNSFS